MRYQSFYPFSNQPPQQRMTSNIPPMQRPIPFSQGMQGNPQDLQIGGANIPQQQAGMQETGPSRADQYMQTANRFFNTAQQFAPLVQQFAPLVQNIPAMWKLYRGFQSMPDASAATTNTAVRAPASIPSPTPRPSIPKVFQPPI